MAGLGALQGQKSPVPEGLRALMDAQEILKQQASPMTPQGTPTVAAQAEQAIQAQIQAAAPQQGMPGMMPNDPFREQLMKTLQMQAQAQMQGQPQPAPEQSGIAQLPTPNMQGMKEGGIVGFQAGGLGDVADYEDEEDTEREELRNLEGRLYDLLGVTQGPQPLSMQGPQPVTKQAIYEQFEKLGLAKPWEAKKQTVQELSDKYKGITAERAALHEKEKGMRDSELWGALFKGQDVGQVKQAMLNRDKAYNESLVNDLKFAMGMAELSQSANQMEWKYNLDKLMSKVDDYNKAADIFKADKNAQIRALEGLYGKKAQAYARKYAADVGAESREEVARTNAIAREKVATINAAARAAAEKLRQQGKLTKETDSQLAYRITLEAMLAEGLPNDEFTRKAALRQSKIITNPIAAARQNWAVQRHIQDALDDLKSSPTYINASPADKAKLLTELEDRIQREMTLSGAPSGAPAPTPVPAPTPAPASASKPQPLPKNPADLRDGVVYQTAKGAGRWNAKKKEFDSIAQ